MITLYINSNDRGCPMAFETILFIAVAVIVLFWLMRSIFASRSNKKPTIEDKEEHPKTTPQEPVQPQKPLETKPHPRRVATELYRRSPAPPPPKSSTEEISKPTVEREIVKVVKELPNNIFPPFDNSRLLSMGLSKEEADAFVVELIEQIESTLPQIDEAAAKEEFEKIERLSHSLKGSATNLGTGGVADILVAFNTYTKTGEDSEIIAAHIQNLKNYHKELKTQFS